MGIRTILAGLSGGTASEGTAELACHLAARFAPHLEALHVGLDVAGLIIAAGAEGLTAAGEMSWAKQMAAAVEAQSQKTKSALAVAADRHGLKLAAAGALGETSVIWHEARGEAAAVLARSARLFDLVVLGRSDRVVDAPHTDVIEETLLHSGRPLLLAPADPPSSVGETVAIGWNGSPQAVRALVAALPFLHSAKKAVIITLGSPGFPCSRAKGRPANSSWPLAKLRRIFWLSAGTAVLRGARLFLGALPASLSVSVCCRS